MTEVGNIVMHWCPADGSVHEASAFCPCDPELEVGESEDEDEETGETSGPVQQIIYRHRDVDGQLVE